jgi:nucleotide-binding universal stress UspA family protein
MLPLDGSELAESALPLAALLAELTGATLSLVRVIPHGMHATPTLASLIAPPLGAAQLADAEAQQQHEARAYLKLVADTLRERGIRVTWEVRSGSPADEIVRTIQTTNADLLVVATHGRTGVRRWVLGSTTSALVVRSSVPILVIPPRASGDVSGSRTCLAATQQPSNT